MVESNKRLVTIGAVLGFLFIVLVGLSFHSGTSNQAQSSIYSPYSGLSETGAPNGTGGGAPASAVAEGQYSILAIDQLPIPDALRSSLETNMAHALNTLIIPTAAPSFIQIDTTTLRCADQYNCSFSFYIDSPERYFAYHQFYKPDGSIAYTIKQLPLAGPSYE